MLKEVYLTSAQLAKSGVIMGFQKVTEMVDADTH